MACLHHIRGVFCARADPEEEEEERESRSKLSSLCKMDSVKCSDSRKSWMTLLTATTYILLLFLVSWNIYLHVTIRQIGKTAFKLSRTNNITSLKIKVSFFSYNRNVITRFNQDDEI